MELDFSAFMSICIYLFVGVMSGLPWVQRKAILEGDLGFAVQSLSSSEDMLSQEAAQVPRSGAGDWLPPRL